MGGCRRRRDAGPQQLFSQIQSMMQPHDGPVNWDFALDLARKTVAQSPDPTPSQKQSDAVADALRLADHWLDATTEFPSGVTSTAAWSRAEWVVGTTDVWKVLVEPIAESSVQALSGALPDEAAEMTGPILGILGQAVGGMLASQIGSGLGALASDVLSVSDIGLPLAAPGQAAIVLGQPGRPSPTDSTSAPTTCCSTSRCARPPTSGCSPTSRGCATT